MVELKQGELSIKEKEKDKKKKLIENAKKVGSYKTVLDYFPDAELVDFVEENKDD